MMKIVLFWIFFDLCLFKLSQTNLETGETSARQVPDSTKATQPVAKHHSHSLEVEHDRRIIHSKPIKKNAGTQTPERFSPSHGRHGTSRSRYQTGQDKKEKSERRVHLIRPFEDLESRRSNHQLRICRKAGCNKSGKY